MYPTSFPALRDKPFSAVEIMLDVKLEFLDAMRTFTEEIGWFCKIFHYCEKTNMKNMIRIVHTFFCKQLFFFWSGLGLPEQEKQGFKLLRMLLKLKKLLKSCLFASDRELFYLQSECKTS